MQQGDLPTEEELQQTQGKLNQLEGELAKTNNGDNKDDVEESSHDSSGEKENSFGDSEKSSLKDGEEKVSPRFTRKKKNLKRINLRRKKNHRVRCQGGRKRR